MATLIDWSQVKTRVSNYAKAYECETDSMALAYVAIESILGVEPEDIEDCITDGPNDRGIDAVVIQDAASNPTVHLFQVKCVTTFEKSSNNFPSNEVDKVLSFVEDLLNKRKNLKSTCNPILWSKVEEIWDAFENGTPIFNVHFVGNLDKMVPSEAARVVSSLERFRNFKVSHHTLGVLAKLLLAKETPQIDRKMRLVDNQYFERVDGNIRGLIATVQATELIALIKDPKSPSEVLVDIFDENVRVYLTQSNRINAMIYKSALAENNAEFWYLNNGVTMTCDSVKYPAGTRAPILEMQNVQIVNGGQTSHALFEAWKEDADKLKNVLVLVRVYEAKEREISLRIAQSTNSQTPIRSRDLRANDPVQRKLEQAFEDLGFFYERKARQHKDKDRAKRIDALAVAQAYVAYFLDMPEVAGKDRGRIFGDLYEQVFNENEVTADRLLAANEAFEHVDRIKRRLRKQIRCGEDYDPNMLFLIDGSYHLLYGLSCLCEQKGIERVPVKIAAKELNNAIEVVLAAIKHEKSLDAGYAHKKFFKSARARKRIERIAMNRTAKQKRGSDAEK